MECGGGAAPFRTAFASSEPARFDQSFARCLGIPFIWRAKGRVRRAENRFATLAAAHRPGGGPTRPLRRAFLRFRTTRFPSRSRGEAACEIHHTFCCAVGAGRVAPCAKQAAPPMRDALSSRAVHRVHGPDTRYSGSAHIAGKSNLENPQ
ncbi:hypothetical protein C7S17_6181 [Burkholderia thailandensis]|nr:hypothetical protein [Burkholderia thailandensis]